MAKIFFIQAYWKDDKSEFSALVYEYDECPINLDDDSVFYFGLSESDIIKAIDDGDNNALEFVITSYELSQEIKHIKL